MRLQIVTPSTTQPFHFALSPDGRHLVFVASGPAGESPQRLWLRPLDRADAVPMAGTENAEYPFWSPDSRSIGFFASNKLHRIDIAGGPPLALASVSNGRGGTWNSEGLILFGGASPSPIWRVAASGGEPAAITHVDGGRQSNHRFPCFLPDGRHFLFFAQGTEGGVYLGSLDAGEPIRLTASDANAAYLPPDWLVFVRQSTLMAQQLNVTRGELVGDPVRLAAPVGSDPTFLLAGFSVSAAGQVAYRAGSASRRQLTWFDRTGKKLGVAGDADGNTLVHPELSPDERRVAVQRTLQQGQDIWLMDLVRGGIAPFTFDKSNDSFPLWSPDGSQIAFVSGRMGPYNLYVRPANAAAEEKRVLQTPDFQYPQDWSRDGRYLLYFSIDPKTARDLWVLDMSDGKQSRRPVVNTSADERLAQFSPDGRWLAYETNASGRFEIVVQPFPAPTGKWQVSTNGGIQPRWSTDGKELYFIADEKLMAVQVTTSPEKDSTFDYRTPVPLFPTGIGALGGSPFRPQYDVSRDGRFLINQPVEDATTAPITLILNWNPKK
jgi:Tol biopolymer transport system component